MTSAHFLALLDLEPVGVDRWIGRTPPKGWSRVYGGQVIAQALTAAQLTVPDRGAHSLHAYFLLGGDPNEPIEFEVERTREGQSFTTRRVAARQRGETIFIMAVSFQVAEDGLEHAIAAPEVPDPNTAPDPMPLIAAAGESARRRYEQFLARISPIEFRPVDLSRYRRVAPPDGSCSLPLHWLRIGEPLPDDPHVHRAALAYLSDLTLLDGALHRHGYSLLDGAHQLASLDHALWFHRPAKADDWLLYVQDSPSAQGARGLSRGLLYDGRGRLVASSAQEGLMRRRRGIIPG
jgi:acyl-CoA thioesterase II